MSRASAWHGRRRTSPALDPVWSTIRREADQVARDEPLMASLVHAGILHHSSLERALSYRIAQKLASPEMSELILREIADEAYQDDPQLGVAARADILAVFERDPACHRYLQPLLFFKGFQALQCYRIGHWLWRQRRKDMAYFIQMRTSEVFGVDIHPGARVGSGIMIDHAHSIVIGETAVGRRQRVDAAFRDARGHRQGGRRPASEDRRRRADRSGGGDPRQHPGRRLQPYRRGLGGAAGRAAVQDGRRRSRARRRRGRMRRAVEDDGPVGSAIPASSARIAGVSAAGLRRASRGDARGCP